MNKNKQNNYNMLDINKFFYLNLDINKKIKRNKLYSFNNSSKVFDNIEKTLSNNLLGYVERFKSYKLLGLIYSKSDMNEIKNILEKDDYNSSKETLESCLIAASRNGYIEVIEFILGEDSLKSKINIHANNELIFITACENNHLDIIKFLIFDFNIKVTEKIKNYLEQLKSMNKDKNSIKELIAYINLSKSVEKMFATRDLKNLLNSDKSIENNKNENRLDFKI